MKKYLILFLLLIPAVAYSFGLLAQMGGAGGGGGGSSAEAFTFVAYSGNETTANSATTLATSSTLNVAAGDTLVAFFGWEDTTLTSGDIGISDGGSNDFTMSSTIEANGNTDNNVIFGYILSASANSTATFTVTTDPGVPYRVITVLQFRSGGGTVAYDTLAGGNGTGTSIATSAITTADTYCLVVGFGKAYGANVYSSHQIGGVGDDGNTDTDYVDVGAAAWYRLISSQMTSGTATATQDSASTWAAQIMSIKST